MADISSASIERLPVPPESNRDSSLARRRAKRVARQPEEVEQLPEVAPGEDEENQHQLDTLA